ncbi:MAG: NAD-dependent epimerase/dehydratase family protein, partial [Nitrososphaerales archaeon]
RGIDTYVIDNLSSGSLENLSNVSGLVHFIQGNLSSSLRKIPQPEKLDVVFHEAAIASVPTSISNPELVHQVNVNASLDLMNFCVKKGLRRFVFASSAAVYGVVDGNVKESATCRPASPYGSGKLAIESYLHSYGASFGLEPVILRYFNVYGLRQKMANYSGVITIFLQSLLCGKRPTITGDGSQTRDFVNVNDIVQANLLAMQSDHAVGEVFNVASGESTKVLELFKLLQELTGRYDVECNFAPARLGDVKNGSADTEKIQKTLGYRSRVSLKAGLADLLQKTAKLEEVAPKIS